GWGPCWVGYKMVGVSPDLWGRKCRRLPDVVSPGAPYKSGHPGCRKTRRQKREPLPSCSSRLPRPSVRHLALLPVLVLIVLDNGGDRLEPVFVAIPDRLLQIEVLDWNVIGSELEAAAHGFEVGLLRRAPHLILLAEIALDGSDNAVEQRHGIVGLGAIEGRVALVSSPVVFDKPCVGLVGQVSHPLLRAGNAEGEMLEARQRQRINGEGGIERNLPLEARLRVLGEELNAWATRIEREDRVGPRRARLRQLGVEVELVGPARQLAADDLPFEGGCHAFEHVLSGRVI